MEEMTSLGGRADEWMKSRVTIGEAAYLGKRNRQLDHEKENS